MPFVAAPVKIPGDIHHILFKFSKSRTLPARQVQRTKIILLAADGMNNMQISTRVGPRQDSVSKWRGRFLKALPLLQEIAEKDRSHLEDAVSSFLNDRPRPGQPAHYTDEQIIRILEIACREPQEFGYEVSHWSLNLLVNAVVKEGIVESISAKTVSRFLKYGEIHPHLIRYWLHSSEKTDSPETFAEKVNEICTVYHEAETVHENGGHTISVDEMTGIQALEHKYPDKPVIPGKAAHMEFEYIRHGTVSLIGFFDVATGRMEKPYLNSTRTEKDFVEAIRALIETDSEAPWTFVCDGLNIHKSESLVRFVAGQCGLSEDLGSKGRSGILKNQESRAEFLHHKDHRTRIVYTPKHCSWMNQIEIWFGIINRRLLKRKSYRSIEELKASILRFVEQYNVMAKPFKWTYKGVPLTV